MSVYCVEVSSHRETGRLVVVTNKVATNMEGHGDGGVRAAV